MSNAFLSGGPGRSGGIAIEEADRRLVSVSLPARPLAVPLSLARGRILARDARSDRPSPPFDRVCMDGYALRAGDVRAGVELAVQGVVKAGEPRRALADGAGCLEVMTGSVLPGGCDAVVAVERTERISEDRVRILPESVGIGDNVHRMGRDRRSGDVVVASGTRLGPCEIAALASVGVVRPEVVDGWRIAVVSTGDELVAPDQVPLGHQIRQSNAWGVAALLERSGFGVPEVLHLSDEPVSLGRELSALVERVDLLVLSGGVSMGRFDLVPSTLEAIGVRNLLHGIAQQPGGPIWMGVLATGGVVAGLPGNPVSALVCLRRHVVPILERSAGLAVSGRRVELACPLKRAKAKTRFVPVALDDEFRARPVHVDGSGDWAGLVGSDGFVQVGVGTDEVPVGTRLEYFPW